MGAMGGRLNRKGIYVDIQLIHVGIRQKLIQHCKAITLQLKKKKEKLYSFVIKKKIRGNGEVKMCVCVCVCVCIHAYICFILQKKNM